ncbi:metal-dependent hydrolase [Segniliparus rugosus]|uniref:Metal-dependent hydrolase n=1 Tax=Segniliparus rugosus (strain ATCC BAA-974 / DSM 45345 / CCUG 50838 / CIP 108380 / JCM 13579 / CDC 945) TaxID=679197 RepID=E5XNA5_SEGRC|nr:metal-dependent hydrolase [Segniliparus rugosus]EFV14165.1 hypothetical protein HMPREF9336_00976 [Segniliparus rugosus ATCC BAA-974]
MAPQAKTKALYPKVRRIRFPFGEPEPMDRYYADDNIALSHFVAGLSFGFPPGEEAFIRSVRRFSDKVTDPVLKKRVAGFIGQEAVHGQQHNSLNEKLAELGYQNRSEAFFKYFIRYEERFLDRDPKRHPLLRYASLASTALAEHFTAIAATRLLTTPEVQALLTDPEVKNLLNWHAFEELEHKSVAFDVYRAANGPEWLRVWMMRAAVVLMGPALILSTVASIAATDPVGRRQPIRVAREMWQLLRGPFIKGIIPEMWEFTRWGFHPDDIDTTALLEKWSEELFGKDGELVGHLK